MAAIEAIRRHLAGLDARWMCIGIEGSHRRNWPIEETWKASGFELRINCHPPDPVEQEGLVKAKESFKGKDCNRLLSQFPDMYIWGGD